MTQLTKREQIAAMCLIQLSSEELPPKAAQLAVEYADALIAELDKTKLVCAHQTVMNNGNTLTGVCQQCGVSVPIPRQI